MTLTICCVADSALYAEALCYLLDAAPWVNRATAHVGLADLELQPLWRPDVALVAGPAGLHDRWIRTVVDVLNCRVIAFGVTGSEDEIIRCAEAGASGYFSRDQRAVELHNVITAVMRDEVLCSPRTAGALMRRVSALADQGAATSRLDRLTEREREVLVLVGQGRTNKGIADALTIDLCTAKNHVHNILEKLQVARRGEAAALAGAAGMLVAASRDDRPT